MEKNDDVKCATQEDLESKYSKEYDDKKASILIVKLRIRTKNMPPVLQPILTKLVTYLGMLISALENKETPTKYKILLMGAIGYIILPFDLIPDALFPFGWLDDIASVTGVIGITEQYSTFNLEELDNYIEKNFPENQNELSKEDIVVIDDTKDNPKSILKNFMKNKDTCIVIRGEQRNVLNKPIGKFSPYKIIKESSKQIILVRKGKEDEFDLKEAEYIKKGLIDRDEMNQHIYVGEVSNV